MQLGLGVPVGRGVGRPAWSHPKSVWAADFKGDRYALLQHARGLSALEATMRSSSHLLAGADGVFRTFAVNTLATIPGVGAYIGGQVTNIWGSPDNLDDTSTWTKQSTPVVSIDGDFYAVADDSTAATEQLLGMGSIPADATTYAMWVDLKKDAENTIVRSVNFRLFGGTTQARSCVVNTFTGAYQFGAGSGTSFFYDLGDRWRVGVSIQNNGSNTRGDLYLNPCFNTSLAATVPDATLTGSASFSWPHMVAGAYPGPRQRIKGTRYATDVRASDMSWFSAVGLSGGSSELVVPNWSYIGAGINRPLFEYSDGTSNNLIKGYIDAADKPTLQIIAGGAVQTTSALTSSIATGRKPLAFGWGAAGGYVADRAGNVATFGAITMPGGLNAKRFGSSLAGNYLNDTIEQQQSCRPLTQAEAQAWAAAA